jgi:hypothetical protein
MDAGEASSKVRSNGGNGNGHGQGNGQDRGNGHGRSNGHDRSSVRGLQVGAVPPEPDVPSPPSTLYITLRRSGNNTRDFETLSRLHQMLCLDRGDDQFVVVLEGADEDKIELEFPNERTQYTPGLRKQIAAVVGADNLRVIEQARW